MKKRSKPNLKKALAKVDKAPAAMFGSVDIDIDSLPCLSKPKKEKITASFDADVIAEIKRIAKKKHVPYTSIMNDVLRKLFIKNDKAG